jgi:hypothetical protein
MALELKLDTIGVNHTPHKDSDATFVTATNTKDPLPSFVCCECCVDGIYHTRKNMEGWDRTSIRLFG